MYEISFSLCFDLIASTQKYVLTDWSKAVQYILYCTLNIALYELLNTLKEIEKKIEVK